MRLREWLDKAEADLSSGPHPDRARRDGEALLLHHLGKSRAWLLAHLNDEFGGCTAIGYAGLLDRRHRGEPIQYITGETEFYGLPFRVTPDVLIPRPETEHLVEKTLSLAQDWTSALKGVERTPFLTQPSTSALKGHDFSRAVIDPETTGALAPEGESQSALFQARILDVGTGSGAIAVALAYNLPDTYVTAIDLSESALSIARHNAVRNDVANRIRFLQGDLLAPVSGEQFEFIVSNPPYVPSSDRDTLSVEVRDHEPSLALFAGNDGIDIYRRLIPAAHAVLVPGGFLALEIGYGQRDAIQSLLTASGYADIEFVPDLQAIPRVAIAKRP